MTKPKRRISDAEKYLLDVKSGKIVACKRIRQLAEMMLPRFENGYKRWHFDIDKAERPVKFIETFCCCPRGSLGRLLVLEPYQKALIELLFGFVDDDGYRQFQEALIQYGRKNGKTALLAALEVYMLIADGEGAPQIYNVANSKDQASLAYGDVWRMVQQNRELKRKVRKGTVVDRDQDGLICDQTMGFITPLTSQTRNLDGLDVHFCVMDEMAANTNRDQYDLIKDGMAAFDRKQPMLVAITTNGFERNGLFDDQIEYSHKILDGKIEDDRLLPMLYELDDRNEWTDESKWIKANPGLGRIKSWQFLRDKVSKAKEEPSSLPTIMVKDFNLPETKVSVWLSFEEAVNEEPFPEIPPSGKLSDIGFRYGVAGIDASDTTDLSSAKILMMRQDDELLYELSMYWITETKLNDGSGYRRNKDDAPYKTWVDRGLVRVVDSNIIPKSVYIDWFDEVKRELDVWVYAIGFDRWGFNDDDIRKFEQYVGKDRSEIVRQGPMTFSGPMKELQAKFKANQIIDGHNPINEWCRMNVQITRDKNSNISPVKAEGKAVHRIDGFVSELNGYIAMQRHMDEYMGAI